MTKPKNFPALGINVNVPENVSVYLDNRSAREELDEGVAGVATRERDGSKIVIRTAYRGTRNKHKNLYVKIHEEIHVLQYLFGQNKALQYIKKKFGIQDAKVKLCKDYLKKLKKEYAQNMDVLTLSVFVERLKNVLGLNNALEKGLLIASTISCGGKTIIRRPSSLEDVCDFYKQPYKFIDYDLKF